MTVENPRTGRRRASEPRLALEGVRVLDFTWAMAGPQATRLLADFGAEVVKIESARNPDLVRRFSPMPHGPEAHGLDSSGYFNHFNRNKRSLILDMQHPGGNRVFGELLAHADLVIENFTAGVLERWGWPYERMREVKPDIIYVSMAGHGQRGPYAPYRTFGPSVQALSGLTHQAGFPDAQPAGWGFSYMDHTGGYLAAIAALMALYRREETGEGEWVDLAQIEGAITLTGPDLLDAQVNGRPSQRHGNRSSHPAAVPHGVYRCADEDGRDRWVAIACYTDDQWAALVEVLGTPAWASSPGLDTVVGRRAVESDIDARLEEWTRPRLAHDVMRALQRQGVAAGVVQNHRDLEERDAQAAHRGLFPRVTHPLLGEYLIDGVPMILSETPGGVRAPAPTWGEHTDDVLRTWLGYAGDQIGALHASGALS